MGIYIRLFPPCILATQVPKIQLQGFGIFLISILMKIVDEGVHRRALVTYYDYFLHTHLLNCIYLRLL